MARLQRTLQNNHDTIRTKNVHYVTENDLVPIRNEYAKNIIYTESQKTPPLYFE